VICLLLKGNHVNWSGLQAHKHRYIKY